MAYAVATEGMTLAERAEFDANLQRDQAAEAEVDAEEAAIQRRLFAAKFGG